MSKIQVDTIDTRSGTSTLTLGSTNASTIALGSGDVQSNFLYPAFLAYLNSNQTISNDTITKVTMDTELFDSSGTYDHSTNYRWTPAVAGKYYIFNTVHLSAQAAANLRNVTVYVYKNGSEEVRHNLNPSSNYGDSFSVTAQTIVDSDDNDYFEAYAYMYSDNNEILQGGKNYTRFGGYRIGT
jgi:hypothetical protein